jgi:hypothetical protein
VLQAGGRAVRIPGEGPSGQSGRWEFGGERRGVIEQVREPVLTRGPVSVLFGLFMA